MARLWLLLLLLLLLLGGCVAPPSPMERLTNSAYDLNTATRFGRMDVATALVVEHAQADFVARHSEWGRNIRIVDVELSGLRFVTSETAEISLAVSWHRIDEMTMRTSFLAQKWTSTSEGWQLAAELRAGGSPGLFKPPPRDAREKRRNKSPNPEGGQL